MSAEDKVVWIGAIILTVFLWGIFWAVYFYEKRRKKNHTKVSVGYYLPRGEHDPDPTEDFVFLLSELTRLREAIKNVPHHQHCAMIWNTPIGGNYIAKCNCGIDEWKRDALKEEKNG